MNKNAVPNDPRPPMVTSGVRIGTALAARGFGDGSHRVADILARSCRRRPAGAARRVTLMLARKFPLHEGLTSPGDKGHDAKDHICILIICFI